MSLAVRQRRARGRERKARIIAEISEYLKRHKVFAIVNLEKIGARELQLIRRKLYGRAMVKVAKNTLVKKAVERVYPPEVAETISKHLRGQNAFIFTDMNPFELYEFLEENKVETAARPGDIAPDDIYIPAGNTGLTPGPILSKMGKLGIPTRIEEGSIFIVKDTRVARKGDVITADLVEILNKLDIKPLKVGLTVKAAFFDGVMMPGEALKIDYDAYERQIREAYTSAYNLAFNSVLMIEEVVPAILSKAHNDAFLLSIQLGIVTDENAPYVVRLAHARATILAAEIAVPDPEVMRLSINLAHQRARVLAEKAGIAS